MQMEKIQNNIELKEYKIFVEGLISNKDNRVFYNNSKEHAAIVMSNIFKNSNSIVRINCGGLHGKISSNKEYLFELDNFLFRDKTKLFILLENDSKIHEDVRAILSFYQKYFPDKISIKKSDAFFREIKNNNKVHFAVGDDSYRIEYDVDKYLARCSFNNSQEASELATIFDGLFKDTTRVSEVILN